MNEPCACESLLSRSLVFLKSSHKHINLLILLQESDQKARFSLNPPALQATKVAKVCSDEKDEANEADIADECPNKRHFICTKIDLLRKLFNI